MFYNGTFDKYSLSEKFNLINQKGKYLGVREYYNHTINLYLVDDTFIEVWYFPAENKIVKIEILEDQKKLDLFIDSMNRLEKRSH
jgi:hypothetical protein